MIELHYGEGLGPVGRDTDKLSYLFIFLIRQDHVLAKVDARESRQTPARLAQVVSARDNFLTGIAALFQAERTKAVKR